MKAQNKRLRISERQLNLELDDVKCCLLEQEQEEGYKNGQPDASMVETRVGKFYSPNLWKCMYKCNQSGVPVEKASSLIRFIALHLCNVKVGQMPGDE